MVTKIIPSISNNNNHYSGTTLINNNTIDNNNSKIIPNGKHIIPRDTYHTHAPPFPSASAHLTSTKRDNTLPPLQAAPSLQPPIQLNKEKSQLNNDKLTTTKKIRYQKQTVILNKEDQEKLEFDDLKKKKLQIQYLDNSNNLQSLKFPYYINTDSESFKKHRELSYAFKKSRKNIFNKKNVGLIDIKYELDYVNDNGNESSDGKTQNGEQKASLGSKPIMRWSAVVEQSVAKSKSKQKSKNLLTEHMNGSSNEYSNATSTDTSSASSPKASITAPASTQASSSVIPVYNNNQLQPLGAVVLRLMYDEKYIDIYKLPLPKITPHGLINTGNICYMNSILQMLLYCSPFYNFLKVIHDKTIAKIGSTSKTPLLDAIIEFISWFNNNGPEGEQKQLNNIRTPQPSQNSSPKQALAQKATSSSATSKNSIFGSPLSPDSFYKALSTHQRFQHLKWGQQEDAEEFLGYLLDGLHEEFVESIKNLKNDEKTTLMNSLSTNESKQLVANAIQLVNRNNKGNTSDETKTLLSENNDTQSNGSVKANDVNDEDDGWHEVGANKKIAAKRTVEIKPSPITFLFGGQFRSVLEVPKQKESKSITLDPFQHVQLDISDNRVETLEDAFKLLSEPEEIPYKSNHGKEVMARKQNFIDKLPNILIIHLKRFSYIKKPENGNGQVYPLSNGSATNSVSSATSPIFNNSQYNAYSYSFGRIEKLRKKIVYSHDLEIPLECISLESRKFNNKGNARNYKLNGVVYHHGTSAEDGHYTVDVLRKAGSWIRIDDGNIYELAEDDVLNNTDDIRSAYILMYQKV
ncbi:hypothetical protein PACTADRAFT_49067 [Pachysolen tannophilus NRRL Y-2460]|uniref:Ubiquitin carboxyl-terminal hydrolase n=1 Tax=Pachysolen tannophilus NRRL Y-2460 TaxID=669874 RepID=A0A1E4U001_PACTA|nr:hypothetical protein PACTADRAFT_49067 [Pachysolen tannophilus NRRL Y-2460]